MYHRINLLSGVALTVLALAPAMAAHAQAASASNNLGDVVVTATKTGATNLQKTPLSVDVISGGDLKKEGIETFRDLQASVPSVKFFVQGTNPRIYIRGVGGYNSNDGDVSLYVDGVFVAKPTAVTQTSFTTTWTASKCWRGPRAPCSAATRPAARSTSCPRRRPTTSLSTTI